MKKILMFLVPAFFFVMFGENASAATDEELEKLRNSGQDYEVELTYEQVVERTVELTGKSVEEVKKEIAPPEFQTRLADVCGWFEVATTLTIPNVSYKPTLIVIPRTCRNGSAKWIETETKPHLVGLKADGKKFEGQIEVRLNPAHFSYVINGTWYDHGTVQHQGTTGLSTVWTATYSVAYSNNKYADWYSRVKYRQVF